MEVAGGTGLANDLMIKAMAAGKSVVTANKAAISANLDDLASASAKKKAPFLFEAAVCGGKLSDREKFGGVADHQFVESSTTFLIKLLNSPSSVEF